MTTPPARKTVQSEYIKTALRLPPALHAEIQAAAEHSCRSMNAEIVARLQQSQADAVLLELAEMKAMLRKVLDQI